LHEWAQYHRGRLTDGGTHHKSFLENPFAKPDSDNHAVLYETGDYGRITDEGVVLYKGRRDVQVKIGGKWVNVAKVESNLSVHPGVERVVALCHTFTETFSVIVAYYMTATQESSVREIEKELRLICCQSIPLYMKLRLVQVPDIPLQPHTGKIYRVAFQNFYVKALTAESSLKMESLNDMK